MSLNPELAELKTDLLEGDRLALSRLISVVEDRVEGYRELMDEVYRDAGDAWVVGVTGPPGVGKSTLVDGLIERLREKDFTVGVIAVDPSSPFTGGAVLGDRLRMGSTMNDDGVFTRSMSARGNVGGLSSATYDAVYLMDAYGLDVVIIETVGAGQSEIDIVRTADTVLVASNPSGGDEVQTVKAGMMEIGDVFVVNKSDLQGSGQTAQHLQEMIARRERDDGWSIPVIETSATEGTGLTELVDELLAHREFLASTTASETIRSRQVRSDIKRQLDAIVSQRTERELDELGSLDDLVEQVTAGESTPYSVAMAIEDEAAESTN